jgi:phage tail-like protein
MNKAAIAGLLPQCVQSAVSAGSPLEALLDCMDFLHKDSENLLQELETFFNPFQTPDTLLPLLAYWVDLDWLLPSSKAAIFPDNQLNVHTGIDPNRLANLIAYAASLNKRRGTKQGLKAFLQIATGAVNFDIEESLKTPFHILIKADISLGNQKALIELIVEKEKPAYATYVVEFVEFKFEKPK